MRKWYVVFTKAKNEKLAEENLFRQGFECFLPFVNNPNKVRARRVKSIIEPLFPCYLFIKVDTETQSIAPVRSTRGVAKMVMFGNTLASIPDKYIEQIQNRVSPESGVIEFVSHDYKPGDKVKVLDGPLAGLEGSFKQNSAEDRVILMLGLLGGTKQVHVRKDFIEPLS